MSSKKGFSELGKRQRRSIKRRLLNKYSNVCQICGHSINMKLQCPHPGSFSVDHIIRLRDGGFNCFDNFQPAHRKCNLDKD